MKTKTNKAIEQKMKMQRLRLDTHKRTRKTTTKAKEIKTKKNKD